MQRVRWSSACDWYLAERRDISLVVNRAEFELPEKTWGSLEVGEVQRRNYSSSGVFTS